MTLCVQRAATSWPINTIVLHVYFLSVLRIVYLAYLPSTSNNLISRCIIKSHVPHKRLPMRPCTSRIPISCDTAPTTGTSVHEALSCSQWPISLSRVAHTLNEDTTSRMLVLMHDIRGCADISCHGGFELHLTS